MQNITPCLWFEDQAEEAARFYVSIFKDSRILSVTHYGPSGSKASGRAAGSIMTVRFELVGQEFMALNGGPEFKFSPAISFMVPCQTQEELDELWAKLSQGGQEIQCGWLQDKYGMAWQIVPQMLGEIMEGKDAPAAERVMKAMLQMKKIDIAALQQAQAAAA